MPRFVHVYHSARNYGEPFWTVQPGQVVEHPVNPAPPWFELLSDDAPVEVVAEAVVAAEPEPEKALVTPKVTAPAPSFPDAETPERPAARKSFATDVPAAE